MLQKAASVGDMLSTMKLICLRLSPDDVQQIDNLRFNVILRMLKSEHFNARMNALKEVSSGRHCCCTMHCLQVLCAIAFLSVCLTATLKLCVHVWHFAIQQQSTAPQSGHALLTQVGLICS